MKRFEYMTLDVESGGFWSGGGKIDTQLLTDRLNELGREGWEIATAVDLNAYQGVSRSVLIMLKRELR
ncbi:hypothetical protein GCM10027578_29470 [Spirosoma luteolum]